MTRAVAASAEAQGISASEVVEDLRRLIANLEPEVRASHANFAQLRAKLENMEKERKRKTTPQAREKARLRMAKPENREKHRARMRTPQALAANRKRKATPEVREKDRQRKPTPSGW